jgi:hypothetical protein
VSAIRRFRSAVTGLFVSKAQAQANPRESVTERKELSTLKLLGLDAVEETAQAVKWLEQRAGSLHDPGCTALRPSARCSCGLHRLMTGLRAVAHDLRHGL